MSVSPGGGRRSKPGVSSRGAALGRLRPCGPRADRRSAFQAGCVIPRSRGTPPSALRPAVPTGGRRSKPGV